MENIKNIKTVILAAGEGSRMKSKKSKVLHEILNKPMINYVIDASKKCGSKDIAIVVGHKGDAVKAKINDSSITFALQNEQKGTGHAVMMAKDFIEDDKDVIILYGDTPLINGEDLQKTISIHQSKNAGATVITAVTENPTGYGRIVRDEKENFVKIVEEKDAQGDVKNIQEINTGIYIFNGKILKEALDNLQNNNAQGEYYLTDCLEWIKDKNQPVIPMKAESIESYLGVNSRDQLATAIKIMQTRINRKHMDNGVTLVDPSTIYIDESVEIGQDTEILAGCHIEGDTVIGEDCKIGAYSRIKNMKIGHNTEIQNSTALDSSIGNNTVVGPYAYIRPDCQIGNSVKIGDFVEIKNSKIDDNTKVPHLSYVGDTDAGKGINFGCGSIMVNYDGKNKHRTTIKDGVFVGCNVNLVAPVTIEQNSFIAAGSTITKNVNENVLVFSRAKEQTEKPKN